MDLHLQVSWSWNIKLYFVCSKVCLDWRSWSWGFLREVQLGWHQCNVCPNVCAITDKVKRPEKGPRRSSWNGNLEKFHQLLKNKCAWYQHLVQCMHKATHKAMIPRLKVTRQSLLKAFVWTAKVGHLNVDPCARYQLPSPLSGAFKHWSSSVLKTIAPKHNRLKGRHTYCNATCSVIPYFT